MLPIAILAGGLATRLGELTRDTPKSLLEIENKPFIYWQLSLLKRKGIEKVVLCLSHKSEMIKNYVQDGSKFGLSVEYSFDGETQLGTGGAIKNALNYLGDKFMVLYGDSYLDVDFKEIENKYLKSKMPALMTVYRNENQFDQSNVYFEEDVIKEYNKGDNDSKFKFIDFGLNFFEKKVFDNYSNSQKFDLAEVCSFLAKSGKLGGYEVKNRFYEVGSKLGIQEFQQYIKGA